MSPWTVRVSLLCNILKINIFFQDKRTDSMYNPIVVAECILGMDDLHASYYECTQVPELILLIAKKKLHAETFWCTGDLTALGIPLSYKSLQLVSLMI